MGEESDKQVNEAAAALSQQIGRPAVVEVWNEKAKLLQRFACLRVGQLGLHENMLIVFEASRVRGVIRLGDLQRLRMEMRKSFKHPVVGGVTGVAMTLASIPLALIGVGGSCIVGLAGVFCFGLGGVTLWEVINSKEEAWLIAQTSSGEYKYALDHLPSDEESKLLEALGMVMEKNSPR